MKRVLGLGIWLLVWAVAFIGLRPAYGEIIYTLGGEVLEVKITEKTEDTIWYEVSSGDIIEEVGIDIAEVEKILNDDGSVSEYWP